MTLRIDDVVLDTNATKAALSGTSGNLRLGGDGVDGDALLFPAGGDLTDNSTATFHLDADGGNLWLGANGTDGDLVIFPSDASDNHDIGAATLHIDGNGGNLWLGGNDRDGDLVVFPSDASDNHDIGDATLHIDGNGGNLWLGGNGKDGDLVIFPSDASDNHDIGDATLHIDGNGGNLWLGGNGTDGDVVLFPSSATNNHDTSQATIHLNAEAGDIVLSNADCAEEFTVKENVNAPPGTVMVLGRNGHLEPSKGSYDKRVVGVISGAGAYRPALILDKQDTDEVRSPIAVMGKVYCLVTAESGPIEVGDLLTTSDLPGHAMKADDTERAFGAVIGKALAARGDGTGLLPVLVALQ